MSSDLEKIQRFLEEVGLTPSYNSTNTPYKNRLGKIVCTIVNNNTRVWCNKVPLDNAPEQFKPLLEPYNYSARIACYPIAKGKLPEFKELIYWLLKFHKEKWVKTQKLYKKINHKRYIGNKTKKELKELLDK